MVDFVVKSFFMDWKHAESSLLSLILPRAALAFKANNRTFDAAGKNNRSENAPKGIDAAGKNGRIRMKTVKNSKRISE